MVFRERPFSCSRYLSKVNCFLHFSLSSAGDGSQLDNYFGQKYIGVIDGGSLEVHGERKLAWTFLNKTLNPGGLEEGGYYFERSWGHRGVIVHVIDPKTGAVNHSDR